MLKRGKASKTFTQDHLNRLIGPPTPKPEPEPPKPEPTVGPHDMIARWIVRAGSRGKGMTREETFRIAASSWKKLDAAGRNCVFQATMGQAQKFAREAMEDKGVGWVDIMYAWLGPIEDEP